MEDDSPVVGLVVRGLDLLGPMNDNVVKDDVDLFLLFRTDYRLSTQSRNLAARTRQSWYRSTNSLPAEYPPCCLEQDLEV